MLSSFVIRLVPAALDSGQLRGDVEHVATGARGTFAGAEELTGWCAAMTAAAARLTVPRHEGDDGSA